MEPKELGTLLRELREEQGSSLRSVAKDLDVDPSYLSRLERGQARPATAFVAKASRYYSVPEELVALARGDVPEDIVAILQSRPDLLEDLRAKYGS